MKAELKGRLHMFISRVCLDHAIIIIIVSIPFVRIGLDGVINQGDAYFPLYPTDFFSRMLYAWDEFGAYFGVYQFQHISHLIFYASPAFLGLLSLPISLVNRLTMIIYAAFVGISGYWLSRTFLGCPYRFANMISAFFLFFNPYIIGELWLGHWFSLLSYAGVTFILIAFAKGLERNKEWIKWSAAIGLASMVVLPRLRLVPIVTIQLGMYLALYLLAHRTWTKVLTSIRLLLLSGLFSILTNLSWILPIAADFQGIYTSTFEVYQTISVSYPSSFSNVNNIFNLIGYGIPNGTYGSFFFSPVAIFIGLAITILSYSAIFFKPKDLATRFFVLLSVSVTVHMVLFVFSPVYQSFYQGIASIFPQPLGYVLFPKDLAYLSYLVAMAYSFLLGVTTTEITKRVRALGVHFVPSWSIDRSHKLSSILTAGILMALILTNSSPLFLGVENDPLHPIQPPIYYDQARLWLIQENGDYRIFVIPHSAWLAYADYNWVEEKDKVVTDILPQVLTKPVVRDLPLSGFVLGHDIVSLAYSLDPTTNSIIPALSAKYILVRNDTRNDLSQLRTIQEINSSLPLEKTIGQLRFYRVPNYVHSVQAVDSILSIWGDNNALAPLCQTGLLNFSSSSFVFLPETNHADATSIIDRSGKILVQADYSNDPVSSYFLETMIKDADPQVAYIFVSDLSTSSFSITDGKYETFLVDRNGTVSRGDALEIQKGTNLTSPNFDYEFSDLEIFGTSIESDDIEVIHGSLSNRTAIKWTADPETPGFHALFLLINATRWELEDLARVGGGIHLRILGDGSGRELRFSFMSFEERRFQWPPQSLYLNWTGWKDVILPFDKFVAVKSPNWSDVIALWIWQDVPNGTDVAMIEMSDFARYLGYSAAILVPKTADNDTRDPLKAYFDGSGIEVNYTKINPTRYVASIESDSAFFLLLNNAYDPGWKAYYNQTELRHILLNSYSNGYYVPHHGKATIEIVFEPQKYFEYGLILSIFAVAGELACFARVDKDLRSRLKHILRRQREGIRK